LCSEGHVLRALAEVWLGLICLCDEVLFEPSRACPAKLSGLEGFGEDEAESEGNKGTVVLGCLPAAQLHALEALQLIRTEEEPKAAQSRRLDIDVATDAS